MSLCYFANFHTKGDAETFAEKVVSGDSIVESAFVKGSKRNGYFVEMYLIEEGWTLYL